jgi:hypothetical protein
MLTKIKIALQHSSQAAVKRNPSSPLADDTLAHSDGNGILSVCFCTSSQTRIEMVTVRVEFKAQKYHSNTHFTKRNPAENITEKTVNLSLIYAI